MNKIDEHNMITFKQLKALLSFFDYYNNGRYYEACEVRFKFLFPYLLILTLAQTVGQVVEHYSVQHERTGRQRQQLQDIERVHSTKLCRNFARDNDEFVQNLHKRQS